MVSQFKVIFTLPAQDQLDAIFIFHLGRFGRNNARRLVDEFRAVLNELKKRPRRMPQLLTPEHNFIYEYRFIYVARTYRIIFRVEESEELVVIHDVRRVGIDTIIRSVETE